jgi:hypothetical protein
MLLKIWVGDPGLLIPSVPPAKLLLLDDPDPFLKGLSHEMDLAFDDI